MILDYLTRDGKGNDFVKKVEIKQFPVESVKFECPICHKQVAEGVKTKKAVYWLAAAVLNVTVTF